MGAQCWDLVSNVQCLIVFVATPSSSTTFLNPDVPSPPCPTDMQLQLPPILRIRFWIPSSSPPTPSTSKSVHLYAESGHMGGKDVVAAESACGQLGAPTGFQLPSSVTVAVTRREGPTSISTSSECIWCRDRDDARVRGRQVDISVCRP